MKKYTLALGRPLPISNHLIGKVTKLSAIIAMLSSPLTFANDLVLSGVVDGPLPGGLPKAIQVYVANDISDLSLCGIGSANNGGGSDGQEFTFPAVSASQGDYLYIASESTSFNTFFGFSPNFVLLMAMMRLNCFVVQLWSMCLAILIRTAQDKIGNI